MVFHSILWKKIEDGRAQEALAAPGFLVDLNLDQIITAVTAGKQEYKLQPFFYTSLHDPETITYRQEIAQDLENDILLENVASFAGKMRAMRRYLALIEQLYHACFQKGWFLEAVNMYCAAVTGLVHDFTRTALQSRGLLAFRDYLTNYAASGDFTSLLADTQKLKTDLATVQYCILIKGNCVKVRKYEFESDYSVEVEELFEKFKQGAVKDYRVKFPPESGMSHVEAHILEFVAQLHPAIFAHLDQYCAQHRGYLDETIAVFDREIQFYVAYLEYIARIKHAGLKFCYPQIGATCKEVYDYEGFDLALADKRLAEKSSVVCNDFYLQDPERICIVSGPNQGGKTTFARTFGQLHYLASLGVPVPGSEARLFLCDRLFTHFEKEEDIQNLRGKLQDDLIRIHAILEQATRNSIIIMNEIFTSTTLQDAIFLSKHVLKKIIQLDLLCVCVTFIDELASLSEQTVSLVSTVAPENPALRTYKIIRKPADGLAYAISIAEKHRVTYDCLQERIPS